MSINVENINVYFYTHFLCYECEISPYSAIFYKNNHIWYI